MLRPMMICGCVLLAGCGSKGGSGGDAPLTAAELEESLAQENISDPSTLPQRGEAIYAGFMTLALPIGGAPRDYVGDLDMTVDFGASRNQVSGTASNFNGLSGALDIAGGDVDRGTDTDVDFTFDGTVIGTLTDSGDNYAIDADLAGEFRGRDQNGLTGLIYGDINGPDGQDIFQGSVAATRTNLPAD